MRRSIIAVLIIFPLLCLITIGIYKVPAVESRLAPRIDNLRTRVVYALNPPEEAVFVPQEVDQQTTCPPIPPPFRHQLPPPPAHLPG